MLLQRPIIPHCDMSECQLGPISFKAEIASKRRFLSKARLMRFSKVMFKNFKNSLISKEQQIDRSSINHVDRILGIFYPLHP